MRPSQVFAMPPPRAGIAAHRRSVAVAAGVLAASLAAAPPAWAVAPAPCGGVVQMSDDAGDGHHANSDVLASWFSEQAGRLQAVVKVGLGDWSPAHDDSSAATFAVLFEVAGARRYVRAVAPRSGPVAYDAGTWTPAGGFASSAPTTGAVTTGPGGTVTIDVPAATGAVAGTTLVRPFALTADGEDAPGVTHWVDRAPGATSPTEQAFGGDYVVGSCASGLPGGPGAPGGPGTLPGGAGATATTAVVLSAPRRLVGGGRVRAFGRVVPARAGVVVRVTARAQHSRRAPIVRGATTLDDGSFLVSLPLAESSTVTAVADAINAQTRTVTVRSTVRLTLRRLRGGRTAVSGSVRPRLPGRVLLLRADAVVPSARTTARGGRFRFAARRLARGRYQAVYIPTGNRAERSTSRTGVVR